MTLAPFFKNQEALLCAFAIAGSVVAGSLVTLVALATPVVPAIQGNDAVVSRPDASAAPTFDSPRQSRSNFDGSAPSERWPCGFGGC